MTGSGWWKAVAVAATASAALLLAVAGGHPARSQSAGDDAPAGLALRTQTFVVQPGSRAHFEFVVDADVPEIIAPTTTCLLYTSPSPRDS